MDKSLFKVTMLSVKRRWKEVLRTFIAASLAVFFVTGILLFEENMFEWQVASNKDRFGNWFIMEANVSVQSEALKNHPKLSGSAEAYSALNLYDENYRDNGSQVGYMSPKFIKMGCINLVEGRMPKADNEIAMDRNTLAKHGISIPEIGQTITIRYYEGNEAYEGKNAEEDMVLVGIIEDYSNVWYRSRYIPGALVTKEKYEAFDNERMVVYIYQLAESERHGDHRAIYEEILSELRTKPAYNSYVYDYKPWSSDNVYNYMYVLVMVIGIAALTYQLVVYKNSRKYSNDLMRRLGATKHQITAITFVENVLMLLPAGLLGMGMAALVGKLVCLIIEAELGISFYYISVEILLKGLLAIVIAVIICEIASVVLAVKQMLMSKETKSSDSRKDKKEVKDSGKNYKSGKGGKSSLKNKHALGTISFRFTKANKWTQNLGVRIFSLGVCVVMVMCVLRIYTTYVAYEANKDNIDLSGVAGVDVPADDYALRVPYYVMVDNDDKSEFNLIRLSWNTFKLTGEMEPKDYLYIPSAEEMQKLRDYGQAPDGFGALYYSLEAENNKLFSAVHLKYSQGIFYKQPKNNLTVGLADRDIEVIENVVGVEDVSYSLYESQRAWSWEGMSIVKMGYERLMVEKSGVQASVAGYGNRNVYATEYVEPTREMYERLCKYIDKDMQDFDAFARGEQALVFIQDNPYGEYDDTLTAGKTINYHYYDYSFDQEQADVFAYDLALKAAYRKLSKESLEASRTFEQYEEFLKHVMEVRRRNTLEPAAEVKAAAVIRMTEDMKKEFADILPSESYYTAIASHELAKKLCERENELMKDLLMVDELEEDCKAELKYNQLIVKYNMLASFSATDNIITKYCEENNIEYVSYAAANEKYRTDFINAILQYGITIIAVIVINMLICAVVARNRLEARKQRTELLLRLGAERKDVRKVFMIEAVREALWCVFTLPIVLLIQYVMYRRNI